MQLSKCVRFLLKPQKWNEGCDGQTKFEHGRPVNSGEISHNIQKEEIVYNKTGISMNLRKVALNFFL